MVGGMRLLAATLACFAAFAAVAVAAAPAAAPTRPPTYDFTLVYDRSGGFAPSSRSLVVAPGQFATADVTGMGGGKRHAEFRLSGRRIRALERGLGRAHFGSLKSPGPSACADCFEYGIFYRQNYVKLDESQIPRRLVAVVAQIEAIIDVHITRSDA
jgi:hypothetical protein